uniref:hypothetical protein n=1 Tax=Amycolatopsis sp. CA-290885 TaxID=3239925 RepID=UPI003F491B06
MGSISSAHPWVSGAYTALANIPLIGGTSALVIADLYGVTLAGSVAALPLGLAVARVIRAVERAHDVRTYLIHHSNAETTLTTKASTAVREDTEPVAVLEQASGPVTRDMG